MLPGCLHTAPLPWRQARYHHAGLTNGVLVLDPWIVSEASAASPGVEGPARCSLPSDMPTGLSSLRATGEDGSFSRPSPRPESSRLEQDGPGTVKVLRLSSHRLDTGRTRSRAHSRLLRGPALLCPGSMTSEKSSPRSRTQFPHV